MKDFHLAPREWRALGRIDKKVLHYARLMEGYYMDQDREQIKQEAEGEKRRQEFIKSLPPTVPRSR